MQNITALLPFSVRRIYFKLKRFLSAFCMHGRVVFGGGGEGCVIIENWVSYTYVLAVLSLLPSENLEVEHITRFKMHNHWHISAIVVLELKTSTQTKPQAQL